MENVIDTLVELAQSGTPITLGSLINTFDEISYRSDSYSGYYTFKEGIYGGQIRAEWNEIYYYIYFVPYDEKYKEQEECKSNDIIKIVQIYNANKSRHLYFDERYCDS